MGGIRVVEVLAALSLTTDLASGVSFEKGLRTCAVATAFGRELGLPRDELSVVFHTSLVRAIGCTSHASENADFFEDDIAFQGWLKEIDFGGEAALAPLAEPDILAAVAAAEPGTASLAGEDGMRRMCRALACVVDLKGRSLLGRSHHVAAVASRAAKLAGLGEQQGRQLETAGLLGTFGVHDFQVLDLMASQNQVAAQIVIELTYPSGGRVRDEELHLWRFDDDHKIAALRHYVDSAKHIAAWNGEDTTRTA